MTSKVECQSQLQQQQQQIVDDYKITVIPNSVSKGWNRFDVTLTHCCSVNNNNNNNNTDDTKSNPYTDIPSIPQFIEVISSNNSSFLVKGKNQHELYQIVNGTLTFIKRLNNCLVVCYYHRDTNKNYYFLYEDEPDCDYCEDVEQGRYLFDWHHQCLKRLYVIDGDDIVNDVNIGEKKLNLGFISSDLGSMTIVENDLLIMFVNGNFLTIRVQDLVQSIPQISDVWLHDKLNESKHQHFPHHKGVELRHGYVLKVDDDGDNNMTSNDDKIIFLLYYVEGLSLGDKAAKAYIKQGLVYEYGVNIIDPELDERGECYPLVCEIVKLNVKTSESNSTLTSLSKHLFYDDFGYTLLSAEIFEPAKYFKQESVFKISAHQNQYYKFNKEQLRFEFIGSDFKEPELSRIIPQSHQNLVTLRETLSEVLKGWPQDLLNLCIEYLHYQDFTNSLSRSSLNLKS